MAEKAKLLEYKYNEDVTKMEKREDQQSRHSNEYGKTIKGEEDVSTNTVIA